MKVRPDFDVTSPGGVGVTHCLLSLINLIWNGMFLANIHVARNWAITVYEWIGFSFLRTRRIEEPSLGIFVSRGRPASSEVHKNTKQ
jgi:hypothetical protein